MKLKFKYSPTPWFFQKDTVKSVKGMADVAKVSGTTADERNDNGLLISCSPDMLSALLAEEAYCSMDCEEGDEILIGLGYKEESE
jgi:hypothetical protein